MTRSVAQFADHTVTTPQLQAKVSSAPPALARTDSNLPTCATVTAGTSECAQTVSHPAVQYLVDRRSAFTCLMGNRQQPPLDQLVLDITHKMLKLAVIMVVLTALVCSKILLILIGNPMLNLVVRTVIQTKPQSELAEVETPESISQAERQRCIFH